MRFEDLCADPAVALTPVCERIGITQPISCSRRRGTAPPLTEVYPWGTIRRPTTEENERTAAELTPDEAADVHASRSHSSTHSGTRTSAQRDGPRPADVVRALITGASGFIGCALSTHLITAGDEVHAVVRPESTSWRNAALQGAFIHTGSILDAAWLDATVLAVKPDVVFHCAAYGAYSFQRDVRSIASTNVVGTTNILHAAAAAGCKRLVNSGTSSEYGDCDHAPSESEAPRPIVSTPQRKPRRRGCAP